MTKELDPPLMPGVGGFSGWKKVRDDVGRFYILKLWIPKHAPAVQMCKEVTIDGKWTRGSALPLCRAYCAKAVAVFTIRGTVAKKREFFSLDGCHYFKIGEMTETMSFESCPYKNGPGITFYMAPEQAKKFP